MNTTDCFFFKIFKWRCSCLLRNLLISWSSWLRKNPTLAYALSNIPLFIFGGYVRSFVAVSLYLFGAVYIYSECFFYKL